MPFTTIDKSSLHFNTKLYTGNNSTQSITGLGFKPDFVWFKNYGTDSTDHAIFDIVRGVTKEIRPNKTDYEDTASNGLTSFDRDGFSIGDWSVINASSASMVSWNLKAGQSQGSSNTDGSINTTYTSVNTTAKFSISKWTGTGSAGTIGHGLGAVPGLILMKRLSNSAAGWLVYHQSEGAGKYIRLNSNARNQSDTNIFNNTAPTSSVFSVGTDTDNNGSGETYVAYCFAPVVGFSSMGLYQGNGNDNGPFIYTGGFKPAFVLLKELESTSSWFLLDHKRSQTNGGNPINRFLRTDTSDAQTDSSWHKIDFYSNGFKINDDDVDINDNNNSYIWIAFAEAPAVASNDIPATAR